MGTESTSDPWSDRTGWLQVLGGPCGIRQSIPVLVLVLVLVLPAVGR